MKKIATIIVIITIAIIYAFTNIEKNYNNSENNRKKIELINCIDGDTVNIKYDNEVQKLRFLSINTKEVGDNEEEYGKEAKEYTCNKLKNANKIEIEFDELSDKYDKYNRLLAWVFIDDSLLQLDLVSKGYAEVKYAYQNYKYLSELQLAQQTAKEKKLGLWQIYY